MATIEDKDEARRIYDRDIKNGIIHEGLYLIHPKDAWKGKINVVAFVDKKQNVKQHPVQGLFEAIISWDGMNGDDECPITMVNTLSIIEPIKLFDV